MTDSSSSSSIAAPPGRPEGARPLLPGLPLPSRRARWAAEAAAAAVVAVVVAAAAVAVLARVVAAPPSWP